ncbi:mucin-3A-like [Onychostoma macrolepis]|uniref:mucin-3A-like n=1 Tax=Onychostoma macrolepis TaxID=369639 RepID=UPI00272AD0A7|nr:mucin-3A-like [Onychostoma macrolepis]
MTDSLFETTDLLVSYMFIRELNVNDSGEYKIIVEASEDYSFFSEFHLNISDADCCEKSISLSAAAGASVNISCKYPQSHSADVKFVCRRSGSDLCAEETSVEESRRWSAEGQIQLYDDREQQLLTGTISHVTRQHSAEYWCGVQSDQGHKSFITRVLISVTEANTHRISTSSSSLLPPSFSSAESSVSPVTGSSLIISVSLLLLLIFTVILSVIVTLWRRHQSHKAHSSSRRSHMTPANSDAVSHYHCDYEETEDNHRQLPTNPSDPTNTIYATPGLPINPSDSTNTIYDTPGLPINTSDPTNTIYATPGLPINPSDSTNTIYDTPGLPTNPSDSTDTIYANPGLPTNPSDSTDTIYANPGLPTNPSDSTDTIYANPRLPINPSDSTDTMYANPGLPINPSGSTNRVYNTR